MQPGDLALAGLSEPGEGIEHTYRHRTVEPLKVPLDAGKDSG